MMHRQTDIKILSLMNKDKRNTWKINIVISLYEYFCRLLDGVDPFYSNIVI